MSPRLSPHAQTSIGRFQVSPVSLVYQHLEKDRYMIRFVQHTIPGPAVPQAAGDRMLGDRAPGRHLLDLTA
jgi:hypothetical protein